MIQRKKFVIKVPKLSQNTQNSYWYRLLGVAFSGRPATLPFQTSLFVTYSSQHTAFRIIEGPITVRKRRRKA